MMKAFYRCAMGLLVAMLVLMMLRMEGAEAKCPYSALWMENSPNKLPDDHPAMQLYLGGGGGAESHSSRTLMQTDGAGSADAYKQGAGTCKYVNPFTQSETCVQMTGAAWAADEATKAIQWCEEGGIGLPGAVGTFERDAVCPGFEDEQFGGVCVNDAGTEEETASVFVVVPGNLLSSCDMTIQGCETFGGGTWQQAGGECSKEGSEEALTSNTQIDSESNETLAEGECKLQAGIAGGGHMDKEAFWSSKCMNSNSSYSMPRRWTAETETVTTQNKLSRTVGRVWYDLENNRRREDSFLMEGELNVFQESYNTTFLHFGPIFYMIAWDDPDNVTCVKMNSPVGILRPNWIIDGEGYQSVAQYLGTEYVVYEGRYRRVKKFRKTEPLEDAYMIQNYDDEEIWSTPEGDKRRPLIRMTPGAPFQGDAVNLYFNHSTDFSDDVFDIYQDLNCTERNRGDSAFEEFREENPELFESAEGGAPGLNFNSSFHVDSSVQSQNCEECDIVYEVRAVEDEEDEDSAPDAIETTPSGDDTDLSSSAAASVTSDFEGSQEVTSDVFVDWKYTSANKTLSVTGTLDKDAWFSIAFPEIECQMSPAVSVIAIPEDDGETVSGKTYNINFNSMSGIQESNDIEDIFAVNTYKQEDGKVVIFLEKTIEDFTDPLSVTWAHGDTRKLGYHFSDGRGCFSISPEVQ